MGEKMSEELELPAGFEPLQEDREERFAQEYLKNPSIAAAGKVAGYADRSTSWRVFYRKHVQDRIKFLQEERAAELGIDAYYVLKNLKSITERCMQVEPILDKDGLPVYVLGADQKYYAAYKFDATGATKANELIGKHLGMFKEDVKLSGNLKIQAPTFNIVGVKPDGDKDTV